MRRKRFLDCDFPLKQTSFCWERTGRHGNRPKAAGYRVWSYSAHTFSIKSLRLAMRGDDAACTRCSLPPSHLSKITLSSKSDPFISIWAKGGRKYPSLKELECLRKPSNGWGGGISISLPAPNGFCWSRRRAIFRIFHKSHQKAVRY